MGRPWWEFQHKEKFLALGSEEPEKELLDVIPMCGVSAGQKDGSFKPCF